MAEEGGFGIWYEYVVKYRIFKKYLNKKKVLIFGLPEKYSLGLDTLLFTNKSKVHVLDNRKKILTEYKKFANKFKKKVKIIHSKNLKSFKTKEKYDLVVSTEVIQNDASLFSSLKKLAKTIIIFVPNKRCYAHPYISKLNSMSLKELEELGGEKNLKLIESGYVDCPLWPAGACLPKSEDNEEKKEHFYINLAKKILTEITPLLTKFDKFYPSPWKEINSHMIYCIFENE